MPLVSVVIPAYNASKFIEKTLDSVLNQTLADFEIIVVNDGSKDNTAEIVNQYCQKDQRVKLINKPNSGVSETRNLGMREANGDYIALLDADDIFLPTNLEKKVEFLEKNPDISFVLSDFQMIDDNGEPYEDVQIDLNDNVLQVVLSYAKGKHSFAPSGLVFRKSCLEKNIAFSSRLSTLADKHFIAQLAFHFKGGKIHEILWQYRNVQGSMSKNLQVHENDSLATLEIYSQSGLYKDKSFETYCHSKTYLMLAGCWWNEGKNKTKALKFILKSLLTNPKPLFEKLMKK